ncbi:hypothetical protein PAXRUDRAFT_590342 [Paxillus rubicundulus Ve08.2h10]|uniref:Uncharacterized protein n=1 Tax=Paxillus rubicundulus Ve08.2h10 TaxID=930991 RepID=A0A0D0E4I0_9AGAM|nr:hypothetical protein PAXRUDRAFT_590342 [Paxillus rubicundulus Ve08.2h10]
MSLHAAMSRFWILDCTRHMILYIHRRSTSVGAAEQRTPSTGVKLPSGSSRSHPRLSHANSSSTVTHSSRWSRDHRRRRVAKNIRCLLTRLIALISISTAAQHRNHHNGRKCPYSYPTPSRKAEMARLQHSCEGL